MMEKGCSVFVSQSKSPSTPLTIAVTVIRRFDVTFVSNLYSVSVIRGTKLTLTDPRY